MRAAILLGTLILAACAATSTAPLAPAPLAGDSGLVIGTFSYQYIETDAAKDWVVNFERLDPAAPVKDYALAVAVDPVNQSGVFTGALPAGVYAFRDAAVADRRYAPAPVRMPFEVTAGSVQDAGHYAVSALRH